MAEPALLKFDEQAYSIEAIQKAAYRHMNSMVVDISLHDGQIGCKVQPCANISIEEFDKLLQDFKKEVLDQQLRLKLKVETEPVRNLILGVAFSQTGLQDNE